MLRDAIYGAYTELYAALSPDVNASQNGAFRKSYLTLPGVLSQLRVVLWLNFLFFSCSHTLGSLEPSTEEGPCYCAEAGEGGWLGRS